MKSVILKAKSRGIPLVIDAVSINFQNIVREVHTTVNKCMCVDMHVTIKLGPSLKNTQNLE